MAKKKEYEDLAVDSKGATRSLSIKESREFQKLVEREYFKNQKGKTINTKKSNSNSNGMTTKAKAPANFVRVGHETVYDGNKGTITMSSRIEVIVITGEKPNTIWTGGKLYSGKNQYGKFTQVTKFDTEWTGAEIKVGKKSSKTYNNKTTNFYMSFHKTTAAWNGIGTRTNEGETE
ncbi:hypothetical protein EI200_12975 [Peribacillus simplex]|uniref:hypothetical protein n=1 Tax=Peribacillus simplex TaxID=1478 RepID=UPI000F63523E|nr:hypothetical protein [Peribacillus simplex]RRN70932.1 hypothetical protein EI200_12975 [Peribacillus simplex]